MTIVIKPLYYYTSSCNEGPPSLNSGNTSVNSQMPRHLISDAHEWINEIPTVPIYYLAKPQPRERAWQN